MLVEKLSCDSQMRSLSVDLTVARWIVDGGLELWIGRGTYQPTIAKAQRVCRGLRLRFRIGFGFGLSVRARVFGAHCWSFSLPGHASLWSGMGGRGRLTPDRTGSRDQASRGRWGVEGE